MNVAFVVNDIHLSGGIGVVVEHARRLRANHRIDAKLVLAQDEGATWEYEALAEVPVINLDEARLQRFDIAIATWWQSTQSLFTLDAARYAYFVQSLEDRFYEDAEAPEALAARLTYDLPVIFLTEAAWIRDVLSALRPGSPVFLVPNGIDKSVFAPPDDVPPREPGPLRVLIEGRASVWFKGVNEALQATQEMTRSRHVTVVTADRSGLRTELADRVVGPLTQEQMAQLYAETDVVLKLSRVEGMFGPPLEGFHCGATCVVTPVTGHEEYVEHGWNGLVTDWDDPLGTARRLDLLAAHDGYLHFLRKNALATAREWPSWDQSSLSMATALKRVADLPAGVEAAGIGRLTADVRAASEAWRRARRPDALPTHRFMRATPLQRVIATARRRRTVRVILRPFRPLIRRVLVPLIYR